MTDQTIQNINNVKQKHAELLLFAVSSCMKADELGISLDPHLNDAHEFLKPLKSISDVYQKISLEYTAYYKTNRPNYNTLEEFIENGGDLKKFSNNQFKNNIEYRTAHTNFKKVYNKFENEIRDEEHSLIKKIISLYETKDFTVPELKFLSGFVETYTTKGRECGWIPVTTDEERIYPE
uniref:Uncharacterized protein n=1 Tax=viral metagenome TaxID=1070528 RepID=A0A6C0CYQ5_9ZZZZ